MPRVLGRRPRAPQIRLGLCEAGATLNTHVPRYIFLTVRTLLRQEREESLKRHRRVANYNANSSRYSRASPAASSAYPLDAYFRFGSQYTHFFYALQAMK